MSSEVVAVVRLGALGDVLRLLPLVGAMRARWNAAKLIWAAGSGVAALLRIHPHVDQVIELPALRRGHLGAWRAAARELRSARVDLCFDLQGLAKSAYLTWASGAPRRIGLARGRAREGSSLVLTSQMVASGPSRYQEGLEIFGLDWKDWSQGAGELRTAWGLTPVKREGILLHPGGSLRNRYKRWPADHFAELARRLARCSGHPILVSHGPGEQDLAEQICDGVPGARPITSASVLELLRMIGSAAVFVGGDTGPLHAALLAGTPAVAIYGPSDPEVYALPPVAPHRVVTGQVPCAPCRLRDCSTLECLEQLRVTHVARAALELLETGT